MDDLTTTAKPWEIDDQTRRQLPKVLFLLALDKNVHARDRARAALALVKMNGQNAEIEEAQRRRAEPPAAASSPAVRIELSADGVEALRSGLLGRLAAPGEPVGSARTPIAD